MASPETSWRAALHSTPFRLAMVVVLVLLLLRIPLFVFGDTWFNLVLGREIAQTGILHTDRLTALGWGAPVLDVQWLAHLLMYIVADRAGIATLVTLAAAGIVLTVIGGAVAALRGGASPGRILLATAAAFMALGAQLVLRAQTLAYPLVVGFVAMLWCDVRVPRRRTWLLVPLAILWANLHGSVLLAPMFGGAMLIARLLDAARAGRTVPAALLARDLLLVSALALAVLATPYGVGTWQYYFATAGNAVMRDHLTEWFPLWAAPEAGLIGLLLIVLVALVRGAPRSDSFPVLVLSGLAVMMLTSVRHATPLALASIVLLPQLLDHALQDRLELRMDGTPPRLAAAALAAALGAWAIGVPWLAREENPPPADTSLEARIAALPFRQCFLVDEQQADRLLWYFPELRRRLSHSVTIPVTFMDTLGQAYAEPAGDHGRRLWRRYPLVAMDKRLHRNVIAALSEDPSFERFGDAGHLVAYRHRAPDTLPDACGHTQP